MTETPRAFQILNEDPEIWRNFPGLAPGKRAELLQLFGNGEIACEALHLRQETGIPGALRVWNHKKKDFLIPERFINVVDFFARKKTETTQEFSTQDAALTAMLSGKNLLITGGPGTGKSHLLSRFITQKKAQAAERPLRITVAAPTGKAAARFQHLGVTTQTIHRFLGMGSRGLPRFHARYVAGVDILIVDEISMVDQGLFAWIVDALPHDAQLILAGDLGQLPAVEGRAVDQALRFLTAQGLVDQARLTQVHRFSAQKTAAYAALQAQGLPGLTGKENEIAIQPIRKAGELAGFLADYAKNLAALLPRSVTTDTTAIFAALRQRVILTEMREGYFGSKEMNRRIAALMTDLGVAITPVIATANNYRFSVFNGDTGFLLQQGGKSELVLETLDAGFKRFSPEELTDWEPAFALTIHKAQGSEYENVFVIYDGKKPREDNRLIYTAVTRARNLATILVT